MKILIWMNIPSHHQSFFFEECYKRLGDSFKVVYYDKVLLQERVKQGWDASCNLKEYESYAASPQEILVYSDFIHVIPGEGDSFSKELVGLSIENQLKWCHWSESSGVRLSEFLSFNSFLYKLISPLFFRTTKSTYAKKINDFALGAFAQGQMAENNYQQWGVRKEKIRHLFYSVPALRVSGKIEEIEKFISSRKVFVCPAQLCERKGIDILIESFASLKNTDWCLVFVGKDQWDGKYQELASKLSLRGQVLFTGAVPIDQMANYMNYADVFVLATRFDGWGVVLNEAASLGKPLISTDMCGASWHLIEEGRNGYRVKAGSVNSLAKAMKCYVDNPALIEEHGEQSKELFKEFTPEKNAERLVKAVTNWLNK